MRVVNIKIIMEAAEELVELWLGWDGSYHRDRKHAAQFGEDEARKRMDALPHRFYMVEMKDAVGICDHAATLLRYVPEDKRDEFKSYLSEAVELGRGDIDWDFLGFMDDYENIAQLVQARTHQETSFSAEHAYTVYDVGCANAWQHVFFPMARKYVGIDCLMPRPEPRFFVGDCEFVLGRFAEVMDKLAIDPENSIGIANMSLVYVGRPDDLAAFDRAFKRKIIL
jgi:hypothetical protein